MKKAAVGSSFFHFQIIDQNIYNIIKWNGYIHKMEYVNNPQEGL